MDNVNYDYEKKVHRSLVRISNLERESAYQIMGSNGPINKSIATVEKKDDEFICKIFVSELLDSSYMDDFEKLGILEQIFFENTGSVYSSRKRSARSISVTIGTPEVITLSLTHFQSGLDKDFNHKKHRLIIPINLDPELSLIETHSLHISRTTTFSGLIKINIESYNYHFFKYQNVDSKKNYLLIDGLEKNNFNDFKRNTESIITAFGYISGNLFLNDYFYQTYDENAEDYGENICYEKKEKSALTKHPLLKPDRFKEYLRSLGQEEKYKEVKSYMTSEVFSKLCNTLKSNEAFARCCKLIIEGNQTKQVLLKAGIYSIALETITNCIYDENKKKFNPIEDKKLASLIRGKLKSVIDEYDSFISQKGKEILDAKISGINQPTNSVKLSFPFEIYKINLQKEDKEILNHRNKFLHGTSPFTEEELNDREQELLYIIARLHYMLNSLILKYIKYNGHIINYPAWIQYNKKEELTDHLFRII